MKDGEYNCRGIYLYFVYAWDDSCDKTSLLKINIKSQIHGNKPNLRMINFTILYKTVKNSLKQTKSSNEKFYNFMYNCWNTNLRQR